MNNTVLIAGIAFSAIFLGMFAFENAEAAVFAKYDGIDGEATDKDHKDWIEVLSFDWEANKPNSGASGQSRRRGTVVVEDMRLTMDYEKSSVKLLEKLNLGEVIPKLEIDFTREVPCTPEPRDTTDDIPQPGELCEVVYLKYELKNVQVTSYQTSWNDPDEVPSVVISNNFEEYKVTYTEYDSEGNKGGNAETTWKVEKGEK